MFVDWGWRERRKTREWEWKICGSVCLKCDISVMLSLAVLVGNVWQTVRFIGLKSEKQMLWGILKYETVIRFKWNLNIMFCSCVCEQGWLIYSLDCFKEILLKIFTAIVPYKIITLPQNEKSAIIYSLSCCSNPYEVLVSQIRFESHDRQHFQQIKLKFKVAESHAHTLTWHQWAHSTHSWSRLSHRWLCWATPASSCWADERRH